MQVIPAAHQPWVAEAPEVDLVIAKIEAAIATSLTPKVQDIDLRGQYPRDFMQQVGALGGFKPAVAPEFGGSGQGLKAAIQVIEAISHECLNTGFISCCQVACTWYIQNSDNAYLKQEVLPKVVTGQVLGGTGLSNPMKHFAEIEKIALFAERKSGGYIINGMLPWVSNLGAGHPFGIAAKINDGDDYLMAIVSDDLDGLTLRPCSRFFALDGSGTLSCVFRDVFIPDELVLAAPCEEYISRIRPGFILTQVGMGLAQGCIELMQQSNQRLGHVNLFLDDQVEEIAIDVAVARRKAYALADEISHRSTPVKLDVLKGIIQSRIEGSELALRSAHAAMLHAGARAYIHGSKPARRLREAYFVAIVTPAIKHLKKLLHDLDEGN